MKINKSLFRSASFWLGLVGEVILLLQAFGVSFGGAEVETAVNSLCALLVTAGILTAPQNKTTGSDTDGNVAATDSEDDKQSK